ncbi:hypothetical protein FDH86_gp003 [Arthrobacter phage Tank]|uniref:Uncharacterized protein n=1 Tax=Arthrobacter phage Tank TaxID=1772319 RepID=A0A0U4IPG9_9CAUD|nr:hypothetical protein FDH86_gp003 [Arthrobacter phage Tank]ALY10538.1 hypothetical protein TANK_3 [Arthrobacter phage Tank]
MKFLIFLQWMFGVGTSLLILVTIVNVAGKMLATPGPDDDLFFRLAGACFGFAFTSWLALNAAKEL